MCYFTKETWLGDGSFEDDVPCWTLIFLRAVCSLFLISLLSVRLFSRMLRHTTASQTDLVVWFNCLHPTAGDQSKTADSISGPTTRSFLFWCVWNKQTKKNPIYFPSFVFVFALFNAQRLWSTRFRPLPVASPAAVWFTRLIDSITSRLNRSDPLCRVCSWTGWRSTGHRNSSCVASFSLHLAVLLECFKCQFFRPMLFCWSGLSGLCQTGSSIKYNCWLFALALQSHCAREECKLKTFLAFVSYWIVPELKLNAGISLFFFTHILCCIL